LIRTWRDTPKPGETDGGWFYSKSVEGHVQEIKGGFKSQAEARLAAGGRTPCTNPECVDGMGWVTWNEGGFERGRYWETCHVCDGRGYLEGAAACHTAL